jgi:tetratricopeptide (TPR) repeat protein
MGRLLDWWRDRFASEPPQPDPAQLARVAELQQTAHRLRGAGDVRGAIQLLGDALALRPDDPGLLYDRGVLHCIAKSHNDAITDLDRALRLREGDSDVLRAPALCERGLAYDKLGDWKRALKEYNDAGAADPSYALVDVNRSGMLRRLGRADLALVGLAFALRLDPDHLIATLAYADCLKALGETAKALAHFERFLELAQRERTDPEWLALAQRGVNELREAGVTPAAFSLKDQIVPTATAKRTHTIGALVEGVLAGDVHFVVVDDAAGVVGAPVYGARGLAYRLDSLADFVGRPFLDLRLGELQDVFVPVATVPTTASEEDARAAATSGWVLVDVKGESTAAARVRLPRGTAEWPSLMSCSWPPPTLFERKIVPPHRKPLPKPPAFRREGRRVSPDGCRRCACGTTFAYYRVEVRDGRLADYLCPSCGRSEIQARIEARMRPGAWSRVGFLGAAEALDEVRAEDARTLRALGIDAVDVARRLDELLAAATSWYETQPGRYTPIALDESMPPPKPSGALPQSSEGYSDGAFQVVLKMYLGYQHCPFTCPSPKLSPVVASPARLGTERSITA